MCILKYFGLFVSVIVGISARVDLSVKVVLLWSLMSGFFAVILVYLISSSSGVKVFVYFIVIYLWVFLFPYKFFASIQLTWVFAMDLLFYPYLLPPPCN